MRPTPAFPPCLLPTTVPLPVSHADGYLFPLYSEPLS